MRKNIYSFVVLCLVCFAGCKKEEVSEFTDSPIIEAYLVPGAFPIIRISRQVPFSSGVSYSADSLNLLTMILSTDSVSHTMVPLGDGVYTDSTMTIKPGKLYYLSFRFNSKEVRAYTKIPSAPVSYRQSVTSMVIEKMDTTSGPPSGSMPDPLELTWNNSDESYYIVVIENMETTLVPIRDFGDKTPPGNMFRKSPTTSSGLTIRPMEFQYYGTHRLILYHVLPDYASLYESQNNSSQNLTNPSTSIINGYGIFTGLNSDTLYVEIKP